ncbi:MAG: hypothetical protein RR956_08075, partial [Christensenella sp.]
MLTYMKFSIGDYHYIYVDVSVCNGIVTVRAQNTFAAACETTHLLSAEESQMWLAEIASLHMENWETDYIADCGNPDVQWDIEYQCENEERRYIYGDCEHPNNWNIFIEAMAVIAPIIKTDKAMSVSLTYYSFPHSEYENVSWDYKETLFIDRETEKFVTTRYIGHEDTITSEYRLRYAIDCLMDECTYNIGETDKNIDAAAKSNAPQYELKITYKKGPAKVFSGYYNHAGLPDGFGDFAKQIRVFMKHYGIYGEALDPSVYTAHAENEEYIYCSVSFRPDGKTYYYYTEDATIAVGDAVLVPVREYGDEKRVIVEKIEHFTEDMLPMPLDEVKMIIGKAVEVDDDVYTNNEITELIEHLRG